MNIVITYVYPVSYLSFSKQQSFIMTLKIVMQYSSMIKNILYFFLSSGGKLAHLG